MSSFRCFLRNHVLVIALSMFLSSCYWNYCETWLILIPCFLVLVLFSFLSQQKPSKSNLDNKSINGDKEKRVENHVHEDVEDVTCSESESNGLSCSSSSQEFSDGSISDEESLIELEIPSGIYIGSPTQTKKGIQEEDEEFITKMCSFHEVKDNELGMEEENLIEIDIAMGSIKN